MEHEIAWREGKLLTVWYHMHLSILYKIMDIVFLLSSRTINFNNIKSLLSSAMHELLQSPVSVKIVCRLNDKSPMLCCMHFFSFYFLFRFQLFIAIFNAHTKKSLTKFKFRRKPPWHKYTHSKQFNKKVLKNKKQNLLMFRHSLLCWIFYWQISTKMALWRNQIIHINITLFAMFLSHRTTYCIHTHNTRA